MKNTITKILQREGENVLQSILSDKVDADLDLALKNKLLFAEKSAEEALSDRSDSIWWFRIAYFLYKKILEEKDSDLTFLSLINVQANAIIRYGKNPYDELLNIDAIVKSIHQVASQSTDIILANAESWNTLPVSEIKNLRTLKNRLGVLNFIVENGKYEPEEKMQELLKIMAKLP
jgi:hypothetical protein